MSDQTALDVQPATKAGAGDRTKLTTAQLNELLHAHFIRPQDRLDRNGAGAVYLTEVTAPGVSGRRADVVHIGLWQSRGAGRIDVCELKTSRSDFRRELEQPAKAEAWWPYSTTFSIVSPGVDITPPEELPPGWGLMVPNARGSRRFKTVVQPQEREPRLTVELLMTLIKNTETTRVNDLRMQDQQLTQHFRQQVEKVRREQGVASPDDARRLDLMEQLEKAMDLRLGAYPWRDQLDPQGAAQGLAEFMRGHAARLEARERTERHAAELDRIAEQATEEAKKLRKAMG
jgi:hypothetical protein